MASPRLAAVAPRQNDEIIRELRQHARDDEKRFSKQDGELAKIKGMLTVLLALVIGSGVLNFLAHAS